MIVAELEYHKISCPSVPPQLYHLDLGKKLWISLKIFLRGPDMILLVIISQQIKQQLCGNLSHVQNLRQNVLVWPKWDSHSAKSWMICLFSKTNPLIHITFSCFDDKDIMKAQHHQFVLLQCWTWKTNHIFEFCSLFALQKKRFNILQVSEKVLPSLKYSLNTCYSLKSAFLIKQKLEGTIQNLTPQGVTST
jgi:hypothetical protein